MSGNFSEDNNLYGPLTKAERAELTDYLIEEIESWDGDGPFREEPTRDWRELDHRPDLKGRRLFPYVGYREASRIAQDFGLAVAARRISTKVPDRATLRLVTLRLAAARPAPAELDGHLSALSAAVSQVFDDIQGKKSPLGTAIGTPLLTALHIRMSNVSPGCFDPHVHAIFDISDDMLKPVQEYFENAGTKDGSRHFGAVWVDQERVRNPKDAAFYVALGVIDYHHVRNWPGEAQVAVWNLQRHRMIRKAGWLRRLPEDLEEMTPSQDNAFETQQDAAGRPLDPSDGTGTTIPRSGDPEAPVPATSPPPTREDWKSSLFSMMRPYRATQQAQLINTTVRAVSSEKKNLIAYPTLGETLACAILVAEAEQRDFNRTYIEVLEAYGFDERQMEVAMQRVEASFNIRLFHAAGGFVPTPEGFAWARVIGEQFDPIIALADAGEERLRASYRDKDRLAEHQKR